MRLTYRRRPVWYSREEYDIDGDEMLHVRLWDVYEQRWRWEWSANHIPPRIMASLSPAERESIRRCLGGAP